MSFLGSSNISDPKCVKEHEGCRFAILVSNTLLSVHFTQKQTSCFEGVPSTRKHPVLHGQTPRKHHVLHGQAPCFEGVQQTPCLNTLLGQTPESYPVWPNTMLMPWSIPCLYPVWPNTMFIPCLGSSHPPPGDLLQNLEAEVHRQG